MDIRARACSLYAQALLESGRPHDAEGPCREAIRLLRKLRDKPGLDEVRALQDRIVQAIAHDAEQASRLERMRVVAQTPLEALLADAPTSSARVEAMLQKAHAYADLDQRLDALPVAERAVAEADALAEVRQQVLARIALARACDADRAVAVLVQASELAGDAREFNLIATIARAAEVAGLTLPADPGPHAPPTHPTAERPA